MGDRPVPVTVLLDAAPGQPWQAWASDPLALVGLIAAAGCYARGALAIRRQVGWGRVITRWQAGAWTMGMVALAVAVASPLEGLAGTLFSAHMTQHVLLTVVAAPLLVLSRPTVPLLQGLPHGLRRRAARWHQQSQPLLRVTYAAVWPLAVAGIYSAVTVLWHLPGPYEAALHSDVVHALEHGTLLGAGLLLWWVIRETGQRSEFGYGTGIVVVFVVSLTHTALGAVLTFAPHVLYAHYAATTEAWGLGPLYDQNLAGLIMWAPGKVVHGVVVVALVVAWLRAAESRAQARTR